jgi:hypothetical protein
MVPRFEVQLGVGLWLRSGVDGGSYRLGKREWVKAT